MNNHPEIFGSVASLLKHCKLNHQEKGEHLRYAPKRASEVTPVRWFRLNHYLNRLLTSIVEYAHF